MFIPQEGMTLSVTLPGEIMRAIVTRCVDRNTVLVEIGQPMAKSHNHQKGDIVACRRFRDELGECWKAVSDRIPIHEIVPEPEPEPEPEKKSRKKKVAA